MCLKSITKSYEENDKEGIGYVVMIKGDKYVSLFRGKEFELGKEYKALENLIYMDFKMEECRAYMSGFHVMTDKEGAMRYYEVARKNIFNCTIILMEVSYRDVRYEGVNEGFNSWNPDVECVVAKYRTILKEVE